MQLSRLLRKPRKRNAAGFFRRVGRACSDVPPAAMLLCFAKEAWRRNATQEGALHKDAPSWGPPLRKREPRRLTGMCLTCRNTCATPVMPVSEQQPPTNVILSYTQELPSMSS